MPKGPAWTFSEIEIIIENAEKISVSELKKLLPDRSVKSIERKIEKLRVEGKIGYRSKLALKTSKIRAMKPDAWNDAWDDKWGK